MILQRDTDRSLLVSQTAHIVFLVLGIVFAVFALASIIAFHFVCQHDTGLQQRGHFSIVCGGLCSAFAGTFYFLYHAELGLWPCFFPLAASYLGTIMYGFTVVLRAIRLMILYRFNLKKSKVAMSNQQSPVSHSRWSRVFGCTAVTNRSRLLKNFDGSAKSMARFDRYLRHVWCTAFAIIALYVILMALFGDTYGLLNVQEEAYFCTDTWEVVTYYILTGFMILFIGPYVVYLVHPIKDSYGLQRDVLFCIIIGVPFLGLFFLWRYYVDAKQSAIIATDWPLLFHVLVFSSNVTEPLLRAYQRKRRVTSLSRQEVEAMFSDPIMYSKLDGLAMASFCAENMRFLDEYQNLKRLTILYYRRQDVSLARQPSAVSTTSNTHSLSNSTASKVVSPFMKLQRETLLPHEDLTSPLVRILDSLPETAWSRPANRFSDHGDSHVGAGRAEMQMMVDMRQSQEIQVPPPLIPHYRAFYNTFIGPNAPLARRQSANDIELLASAKKNASVCILPIEDDKDKDKDKDGCIGAMQVNISEAAREEACPAIDRPDHWNLGMFDRAHSEVVQMITFGVAMDLIHGEATKECGIQSAFRRFRRWLWPLSYPEAGVQSATSTLTTITSIHKPSVSVSGPLL